MRKYNLILLFSILTLALSGCARSATGSARNTSGSSGAEGLLGRFAEVVNRAPGIVGVAYVDDRDTILLNNGVRFPMMSVFKLHQCVAVAAELERRGRTVDSLLTLNRSELDPATWSPMLKDYPEGDISISVGRLMDYALQKSDNNASNELFRKIISPEATDEYIRSTAADTTFRIRYTESEMKREHELSYENYTSPLSAALLIKNFMTDTLTYSSAAARYVRESLRKVTTGADRLKAGESAGEVTLIAHKTGSGFRNSRGELMAHNDVGYFRRADGRWYALAVFVRDFRGSEAEASEVIAAVSRIVATNEKKL